MSGATDELAALEAERDALLRSLDDLDRERAVGDLGSDEYARLHDDYTARAAAVIRMIRDGVGVGVDAIPTPTRSSRRRRVLTVAGVVTFTAVTAFGVTRALGERLPGETATGNDARAAERDRRAAFEDEIARRPDDPTAYLSYARYLLGAGDEVEALRQFDAVAALDPKNAEARAYGGWIVFLAGLTEEALERLDGAVAVDPAYPDAHFFRGMVLYRGKGDPAAAIPELQRYLAGDPTGPLAEQVRTVLASAVAETGQPALVPEAGGATGP